MEVFERLAQKEAVKLAESFADRMTEELKAENRNQPLEGKLFFQPDKVRHTLISLFVSFLAEQYVIVPE